MGIPLIIDADKLQALRIFAEQHPFTFDEMVKIVRGLAPVVGDRQGYFLDMEFGYRVVFSIEEHPLKDGNGTVWLRHMSLSLRVRGRCPNQFALSEVGHELGFPPIDQCLIQTDPHNRAGIIEMIAEMAKPPVPVLPTA